MICATYHFPFDSDSHIRRLAAFDHVICLSADGGYGVPSKLTYLPDMPTDLKGVLNMIGELSGTSCLVRSDMLVSTTDFDRLEARMWSIKAACATAWKYYHGGDNSARVKNLNTNRLDCFVAVPDAWRHAASLCPDELKLDGSRWDVWLYRFMLENYKQSFYDFTGWKSFSSPAEPEIIPFSAETFGMPIPL